MIEAPNSAEMRTGHCPTCDSFGPPCPVSISDLCTDRWHEMRPPVRHLYDAAWVAGLKAENERLRSALSTIALLAQEANEEYEGSCRRKVSRIRSTANDALRPQGSTDG
jgi:hypothetical protein